LLRWVTTKATFLSTRWSPTLSYRCKLHSDRNLVASWAGSLPLIKLALGGTESDRHGTELMAELFAVFYLILALALAGALLFFTLGH
jgi:hypothetical protein